MEKEKIPVSIINRMGSATDISTSALPWSHDRSRFRVRLLVDLSFMGNRFKALRSFIPKNPPGHLYFRKMGSLRTLLLTECSTQIRAGFIEDPDRNSLGEGENPNVAPRTN
jgi:hypothetical protein